MTDYALIVAGDKEAEKRLIETVARSGFTALVVPDFAQAQRMIDLRLPSVVVVSHIPGDRSAGQLCQALRGSARTSRVPLIIVTQEAELDERLGLLDAGADECVPSSCHDLELSARVSTVVRGYASRGTQAEPI